jgi:tRNA A-37 threonylcarbamoyl transferase component Bud32
MPEQRFGLVGERYRLRGQLGQGGMGRVWLARDEMLDRDVAIKEVAPSYLSPEEAKQLRVLIDREARAAARVNHPNVVKIFDVIPTDQWPWLIMEYVPSTSLQRTVQLEGPMAPVEVARIGLAVLEGLTAAHDSGVLHRDVKPDNVLLADDGRVMLTDFGLASLDADGKATRSGTLGTPQYVAPERARHGVSSREADLWSLGATLYAAVEGRSPYQRDTVLETLSALAVDPPDPMRLAGPLEPVISGLLQRDPVQRTHPDRLADQLRTVIAGGHVPMVAPAIPARAGVAAPKERLRPRTTPPALAAPPPAPPADTRKRTLALAGAGIIVAAVVIGLILAETMRDTGQPVVTGSSPSALGPLACEIAPTHTAPLPVTAPAGGGQRLPENWVWFTDQSGWTIAVPEDWTYWRVGNAVCFRDPYGTRVMSVVRGVVAPETLRNYHKLTQHDRDLRGPATEWEFTYSGPGGMRHAIGLATPGHTILWITDDSDFAASRSLYDEAVETFDAHGGPRPPGPEGGPEGGPGGPGSQPRPSGSPGGSQPPLA